MMKVRDLPKEATLVRNTQDVKYILRNYLRRKRSKFRTLFVVIGDGDYEAIWGCKYYIPYDDDNVRRLL
jgi:hypothetical protein